MSLKTMIKVAALSFVMMFSLSPERVLGQTQSAPITFYDGGWENIQISNAIAIYMIKHGFGRQAVDVDSNVPKMQNAMRSGTMDVNLEMYNNLMAEWVSAQVTDGKIVELGETYESASQGFYVPTYVIKGDAARGIKPLAPDLSGVQDLRKYLQAFRERDPDRQSKFINCIPGWACREINLIKLATYGLDNDLKSIEPKTENELNETILKEYEAGRPFITYYWAPSALPTMIDLTLLKEPAYDPACWAAIEKLLTPFQPGVPAERACAYETIPILKYATKKMVGENPDVVAFLRAMFIGSKTMGELAAYMHKQKATPDETALYFLRNHQTTWTKWVSDPVRSRVAASLSH